MKTSLSTPSAILAGSVLIAGAILLKPSSHPVEYQALYGDGYVYVVDLPGKNIANIIPGKTAPPELTGRARP